MKPIILLLLLAFGCSEEETPETTGCRTAVSKESGERVFLRCEMRSEFNPTNIRASQWNTSDSLYYSYQWELCDNCK